jgi:hypothetical protein
MENKNVKKILLGLAALSVIGLSSISAPSTAQAQGYGPGYHGPRAHHRTVVVPPRYNRHRHVRAQVCTVRHVMKRDWRGRMVRNTIRTCR